MTVFSATDDGLVALPSNVLWRDRAACRELGAESSLIFFPSPGQSSHAAKAICASCPVREECLAFAVEFCCEGIWGGTTDSERRQLRRRRRLNTLVR
jgi:WhiB family redox-sensing transcriptional regulator